MHVAYFKTLKKPAERMMGKHKFLAVAVEKMNVKLAPMTERLSKQKSEKAFLLLGGKGDVAPLFVGDAVFVAGFETEQLGPLERLL